MAITKQIPPADWTSYFDGFSRRYLKEGSNSAAIEIVSPTLGDAVEATGARLLGLTYDPKSLAFEVLLEGVDHLAFELSEIWVVEQEGGFISALELVRTDGSKEIIYIRRSTASASVDASA